MGGKGDTTGSGAGTLLDLARRAGERPAVLAATVRHWEDRDAASHAWRAAIGPGRGGPPADGLVPAPPAGPRPATTTTTVVRLWQDPASGRGGEEVDGGPAHDGVVLFAHLLRPLRALTDLRLAPAAPGTIAGRPARVAAATPLRGRAGDRAPGPAPSLDALGFGADRYVLGLDAEHGVLLRLEAWHAGSCFARTDVTQIAFGAAGAPGDAGLDGPALRLVDPPARSRLH